MPLTQDDQLQKIDDPPRGLDYTPLIIMSANDLIEEEDALLLNGEGTNEVNEAANNDPPEEATDDARTAPQDVNASLSQAAPADDTELIPVSYDAPPMYSTTVLADSSAFTVAVDSNEASATMFTSNELNESVALVGEATATHPSADIVEPPLKRVKLLDPSATNETATSTAAATTKRKQRKEFTATEKLAILSELDPPNSLSIKEILQKYNLSKSSFHRWRQPDFREKLVCMAGEQQAQVEGAALLLATQSAPTDTSETSGETPTTTVAATTPSLLFQGNKTRSPNDALYPLKRSIQEFITYNASLPKSEQYAIRSAFLQIKSRELRNELLEKAKVRDEEIDEWKKKYEDADPILSTCPEPLLSTAQKMALKNFKGSKSWSCHIASTLGLLQTEWSEASELNSQQYISQAQSATIGPLSNTVDIKQPKKLRVEFTTAQKIHILNEIDADAMQCKSSGKHPMSVQEICQKYNTSKSSLHRWRQQQRSGLLDFMENNGNNSHLRNQKRIFKDRYIKIKEALVEYVRVEFGEKRRVGFGMLQEKALVARDELMREYEVVHGLRMGDGADGVQDIMDGDDGEKVERPTTGVVADPSDGIANAPQTENEAVSNVSDSVPEIPMPTATATASTTTDDSLEPNEIIPNSKATNDNIHCAPESVLPIDNEVANNNATSGEDSPANAPNPTDATPSNETTTDDHQQQQLPLSQSDIPTTASILTHDEYQALRSFKASVSWLRELAKKYNFPMDNADDSRVKWTTNGNNSRPAAETEEEMEQRRLYYEGYYPEETGDVGQEEHMPTELEEEMHPHDEEGAPSQEDQEVMYHGEPDELPVHNPENEPHPQDASQDTTAIIADAQVEEILNSQDGLGEMTEEAESVPTHHDEDVAAPSWV